MHIAYISKDITVEFRSVSFLAYDIIAMVEVRHHSVRQTSGMRSWMVGLVVPSRSPRYVKGIVPMVHPKMFAMSLLCSLLVLIGIKVDLWKLIVSPMESA